MGIRKKIQKILLWLLLLAAAAAALTFCLGIRPVYVKSGSMEPALPVGSLCLVHTKADREKLRPGDVIVFRAGEMEVAHRVIERTKQGFYTKGDANDSPDPGIITPENVKGKVIAKIPCLGYAAAFFRSRIGVLLLLSACLFAILWGRQNKERRAGKTT